MGTFAEIHLGTLRLLLEGGWVILRCIGDALFDHRFHACPWARPSSIDWSRSLPVGAVIAIPPLTALSSFGGSGGYERAVFESDIPVVIITAFADKRQFEKLAAPRFDHCCFRRSQWLFRAGIVVAHSFAEGRRVGISQRNRIVALVDHCGRVKHHIPFESCMHWTWAKAPVEVGVEFFVTADKIVTE